MVELLKDFVDIFLHLDKHLDYIITNFGIWTYVILFTIIFVETGVVIMPFLPGDSLLFMAGALAAIHPDVLNVWIMGGLLFVAAFLGDTLNYHIGKYIGPKVFKRDYKLLKRAHLVKTQAFYDKHGGKTIIFARFIPIIRTFAPFVAGVGTMSYGKFISYNIIGGFVWVFSFLLAGYFFGEIPIVKNNLKLVLVGIIVVSLMPPSWEYIKHIRARRIARRANSQA